MAFRTAVIAGRNKRIGINTATGKISGGAGQDSNLTAIFNNRGEVVGGRSDKGKFVPLSPNVRIAHTPPMATPRPLASDVREAKRKTSIGGGGGGSFSNTSISPSATLQSSPKVARKPAQKAQKNTGAKQVTEKKPTIFNKASQRINPLIRYVNGLRPSGRNNPYSIFAPGGISRLSQPSRKPAVSPDIPLASDVVAARQRMAKRSSFLGKAKQAFVNFSGKRPSFLQEGKAAILGTDVEGLKERQALARRVLQLKNMAGRIEKKNKAIKKQVADFKRKYPQNASFGISAVKKAKSQSRVLNAKIKNLNSDVNLYNQKAKALENDVHAFNRKNNADFVVNIGKPKVSQKKDNFLFTGSPGEIGGAVVGGAEIGVGLGFAGGAIAGGGAAIPGAVAGGVFGGAAGLVSEGVGFGTERALAFGENVAGTKISIPTPVGNVGRKALAFGAAFSVPIFAVGKVGAFIGRSTKTSVNIAKARLGLNLRGKNLGKAKFTGKGTMKNIFGRRNFEFGQDFLVSNNAVGKEINALKVPESVKVPTEVFEQRGSNILKEFNPFKVNPGGAKINPKPVPIPKQELLKNIGKKSINRAVGTARIRPKKNLIDRLGFFGVKKNNFGKYKAKVAGTQKFQVGGTTVEKTLKIPKAEQRNIGRKNLVRSIKGGVFYATSGSNATGIFGSLKGGNRLYEGLGAFAQEMQITRGLGRVTGRGIASANVSLKQIDNAFSRVGRGKVGVNIRKVAVRLKGRLKSGSKKKLGSRKLYKAFKKSGRPPTPFNFPKSKARKASGLQPSFSVLDFSGFGKSGMATKQLFRNGKGGAPGKAVGKNVNAIQFLAGKAIQQASSFIGVSAGRATERQGRELGQRIAFAMQIFGNRARGKGLNRRKRKRIMGSNAFVDALISKSPSVHQGIASPALIVPSVSLLPKKRAKPIFQGTGKTFLISRKKGKLGRVKPAILVMEQQKSLKRTYGIYKLITATVSRAKQKPVQMPKLAVLQATKQESRVPQNTIQLTAPVAITRQAVRLKTITPTVPKFFSETETGFIPAFYAPPSRPAIAGLPKSGLPHGNFGGVWGSPHRAEKHKFAVFFPFRSDPFTKFFRSEHDIKLTKKTRSFAVSEFKKGLFEFIPTREMLARLRKRKGKKAGKGKPNRKKIRKKNKHKRK